MAESKKIWVSWCSLQQIHVFGVLLHDVVWRRRWLDERRLMDKLLLGFGVLLRLGFEVVLLHIRHRSVRTVVLSFFLLRKDHLILAGLIRRSVV